MKKISAVIISVLLTGGFLSAGGKNDAPKTEEHPATLKIAALTGPSGLGMAYLFSNPPNLGAKTVVSFETAGSADILLPKLISGEVDIGVLPTNVAAKLYSVNKNSIVAGAVVGNSMLALITRDPAIHSVADLAGKTVSVAGQGATPEYVLRTLIAKSGLPEASVTLDFSIPNPEIAAALVSNRISYALVPEPFATVAIINGTTGDHPVHRAFLVKDAWNEAKLGSDFPMTLCVIRKEYAEKHPVTVRKFLEAYKASIEWTVANPGEAGKLVESSGLGLKAPVASKAIPSGNFVFIPASESKEAIEQFLSVFLAFAPEAIGGKLPDEGFYFK